VIERYYPTPRPAPIGSPRAGARLGSVVAGLDHHLVDFGRERVQLLVVAHADGADVRAVPFSGLNLPVLADPHDDLVATFGPARRAPGSPRSSTSRGTRWTTWS